MTAAPPRGGVRRPRRRPGERALHASTSRILLAAAAVAALVAGFAAGWLAREVREPRAADRRSYVQRREGRFRFVNPLLECELADDVLRNQELVPFKANVGRYVASRLPPAARSNASVYFRELNDGIWFSIGESEKFTPASLRKVPMMIALLKSAEGPAGAGLLDRRVTFDLARDQNKDQNLQPAQRLVLGQPYSVRELVERMIIHSDNNAFVLLSRVVDPAELDRAYALLRVQDPRAAEDDQFLSVQTHASFLRILYNATYLTKEHSEWALALLAATEFRDGLVAGVPDGIPVAHKFGEKSDPRAGVVELHECGIVYHPENPYLLCVMTRGRSLSELASLISGISRFVYGEVLDQLHGDAP